MSHPKTCPECSAPMREEWQGPLYTGWHCSTPWVHEMQQQIEDLKAERDALEAELEKMNTHPFYLRSGKISYYKALQEKDAQIAALAASCAAKDARIEDLETGVAAQEEIHRLESKLAAYQALDAVVEKAKQEAIKSVAAYMSSVDSVPVTDNEMAKLYRAAGLRDKEQEP